MSQKVSIPLRGLAIVKGPGNDLLNGDYGGFHPLTGFSDCKAVKVVGQRLRVFCFHPLTGFSDCKAS